MSSSNGTDKTKSRFSLRVMDYPLVAHVSEGMFKAVIKRIDADEEFKGQADYIRKLIMKDLKIDEFGNRK